MTLCELWGEKEDKHSSRSWGCGNCNSDSVRDIPPLNPAYLEPCDQFPMEKICVDAKEAEMTDGDHVDTYSCFYRFGGDPSDEDLTTASRCTNEPLWMEFAKGMDTPPNPIEGFDTRQNFDLKSFDVEVFEGLVAMMARANGMEVPAHMRLPHELDPKQQEALAAGVQVYNQLVTELPKLAQAYAEQTKKECNALPKDGWKPIRCWDFDPNNPTVEQESKPEEEEQDDSPEVPEPQNQTPIPTPSTAPDPAGVPT
jgi:hypothetical protein